MKKVLRIMGILLGSLIGLILLTAGFIAVKPMPNYQEEVPLKELTVEVTPERVKVGAQISSVACNHCHGDKGVLQGKFLANEPGFGSVYPPNITQSKAGIADYTDAELYRLLRTGVLKNGNLALPMMWRFPHAAEEDILSIIAYLKSDAKAVQPSDHEVPVYEPTFLARLLSTVAFKPFPLQEVPQQRPAPTDAKYGHYLANSLFACFDCHSSAFNTNDFIHPEKSPGFYGGGTPISVGDMEPVVSTNITMDQEDGIGSWSADEFLSTVMYGKKPDGTMVQYPMLPYSFLDSTDVYAIYEYIKTVPTIRQAQVANVE